MTVTNPGPGGGRSNAAFFPVGTPESAVNFLNAASSPLQFSTPFGLAVADLNNDGKVDLAISDVIRVHVLLGNGDGTFTPAAGSPLLVPSPPFGTGVSPYTGALAIGDFNGDGKLGLAVGLFQNQAATILFGKGDGTFEYSDTPAYLAGQSITSLSVADFNEDGNLDMLASNTSNGVSPLTLMGYGHGAFTPVGQILSHFGNSSALGDFNNDGRLDVTVDGTGILLGNGDGTFTEGTSLNVKGYVTAGDFNKDGSLDLAICDRDANNVAILLGDGSGGFAAASGSPIAVGSQPDAIAAGDFNDDGTLDLAVAYYGEDTITLLTGNGDGTFNPAVGSPYTGRNQLLLLASADFNGDGKLRSCGP